MSRGTPHISLRIDPAVLAAIDAEVERVNRSKGDQAYNRTTFILHAVHEKVEKLKRGRNRRRPAQDDDGDGS